MRIDIGVIYEIKLGNEKKRRFKNVVYYMAKRLKINEKGGVDIIYIDGNGIEQKDYFAKKEVYDIQVIE